MVIEIKLPALSPTMEKAAIAKWLVQPGDVVKRGDLLAEIETDKATMELEASDGGRIAQILVPGGSEDVPVGAVLALIAEENEALAELALETAAAAPAGSVTAASAEISHPRHDPVPSPQRADGNVRATPLARRLAAAMNVALTDVQGTGAQGKIVKADLNLPSLFSSGAIAPPVTISAPSPTVLEPPEGIPVETVKLGSMRKTIARRLTESKQQIPHFYLTARCNLDAFLALRMTLNDELADRNIKISVNDMLMKAMAMALVQVPEANVQFGGEVLHQFSRVDISMAVAVDGGLITPVLRNVDRLALSAIAERTARLAEKARAGKLTPQDYQGGTVSLSNLGMFGIDEMVPVINPPQALILGTAAGIRQPWDVNGEIALATIMAATGSFDHRAIDGAVAARFMAAFRQLVEAPMSLLL